MLLMWMYQGNQISEIDTKKFVAFVYKITNNINGRYYIGYKQTLFSRTRQEKGKKKKYKIESDWRDYWSSSEELKREVKELGEENFTREILYLCKSISMASYLEMREQIDLRVLENPDKSYNGIINARVSKLHLKNVLSEIKGL